MMSRKHIISAVAAAILSVSLAGTASAGSKAHKDNRAVSIAPSFAPAHQNKPLWAQRSISASEAKAIARSRVPGGEVVDVSKRGNTYRVRVIRKDGRVVDVFIDAATGRVKR